MATLFVFEKRLGFLHPPGRRAGLNLHCQDMRTQSVLGSKLPNTPEGTRQGLEAILKQRTENTTKNIVELLSPHRPEGGSRRLAYNIANLASYNAPQTPEFRGHQGTLNPDGILNWLNVCSGLVEFADSVEDDLLDDFLRRHIDDQDFTVIDLLNAIGKHPEAEYYAERIQKQPTTVIIIDDSDDDSDDESPQLGNSTGEEELRRLSEEIRVLDAQLEEKIRAARESDEEARRLNEESARLDENIRAYEREDATDRNKIIRKWRVEMFNTTDEQMAAKEPLFKELLQWKWN